jgi:predicted RNase H-like HicB family nuclease
MSEKDMLYQRAKEISQLPYFNQVSLDETTEGKIIYIAKTLELPGCISQGKTSDEALKNLGDARIDFIFSLLEDGLPIPEPTQQYSETSSINGTVYTFGKSPDEELIIQDTQSSFILL